LPHARSDVEKNFRPSTSCTHTLAQTNQTATHIYTLAKQRICMRAEPGVAKKPTQKFANHWILPQ